MNIKPLDHRSSLYCEPTVVKRITMNKIKINFFFQKSQTNFFSKITIFFR